MSIGFTKSGMHVMITGGSGMTGKYLTSLLLENGYKVSHLSRKQEQFGRVRVFRWDPDKGIIDPVVLDGVDCIIHLAGAGIGDKRWSKSRRAAIIRSRVNSASLLYKTVSENNIPLKVFITASASGYYGSVTSDKIFAEDDESASDFLGNVCRLWEEAADNFRKMNIRVVKIRTGVVLASEEGALPKLLIPLKFRSLPIPGKGNQYFPWIHMRDLCGIYLKAVQDPSLEGAFNAVSPQYVTMKSLMLTLSEVMGRHYFHPRIPGPLLALFLGNMSSVLLTGSRISSEKIKKAGYHFEFDNLHNALCDLICRQSASLQS